MFAAIALSAERIETDAEATPAFLHYIILESTLARAFLEGWYER